MIPTGKDRFRVERYYSNNGISFMAIWDKVEKDYVHFADGTIVSYARDDRTGEIVHA